MLRKCIGCGELKPADNLIRITRDYKNGNIVINPDSKTFGRSAYLCYNQSCINKAIKKSGINKALRTKSDINKEILLNLAEKN